MKFKMYQCCMGLYHWHLVAGNGKIMASSSHGYEKRSDCVRAIKAICCDLSGCPCEDCCCAAAVGHVNNEPK